MNEEAIATYISYQINKNYRNVTIDSELERQAKEELTKKEPRTLKTEKDTEISIESGNLIEEYYAQILKKEIEKHSDFYRAFFDGKKIIIQIDETQDTSIQKDNNAYYLYINMTDAYVIPNFSKAIISGADNSEKDEVYNDLNNEDNEAELEKLYFYYLESPEKFDRKSIIKLLSKTKDYENLKDYLLGKDVRDRINLHIAAIQLKVLKKNLKSIYPEICKSLSREDYKTIKNLMFTHLDEMKENSLHKQETKDKIENNSILLNQKNYAIIIARKILRELDPSLELLNHFNKKESQNQIDLSPQLKEAEQEENAYKKTSQTKGAYYCDTGIISSNFNGTIESVIALIHETIHSYVEENAKENKDNNLLSEFPSIYYEIKAEEYLLDLNLESKFKYFRIANAFYNWTYMYYIFEMMLLIENNQFGYENIQQLTFVEDGIRESPKQTTVTKGFLVAERLNRFFLEHGEEAKDKLLKSFSYPIGFLLVREAINKGLTNDEVKEICKYIKGYDLHEFLEKITSFSISSSVKVS